MGNSLQDQLLKAGLVSEDQLRTAREPPSRKPRNRKPRKRGKPSPRASSGPNPGGDTTRAATANAAPASLPLEALNKKIRGLLDEHRQNEDAADVPYNFTRESRIKKLYVTEPQRTALLAGELAIVGYRRVHHIVPAAVANEITDMRSEIFVHQVGRVVEPSEHAADDPGSASQAADAQSADAAEPGTSQPPPSAENDLMAEHPIPDDLTW